MDKTKRRKGDDGSMDRISELPQPILHHILCFLPQNQAVRTCVLSQSWRHIWCTRPSVEFNQNLFRGNLKALTSILDETLQRYHHQNLSIKQFVVKMRRVDLEFSSIIEKWIPIVLMNLGVETFHLMYPGLICYPYPDLLPVVFQAEFLKELCLSGFKIKSTDDELRLNHLQTLLLNRVYIEDEALEKILASCPLIQHVDLKHCSGLTTVKANNLNHFTYVFSCHKIEIKSLCALENLKILSAYYPNCYLYTGHNSHFSNIKSLCLKEVHLSEDFSGSFSCNSPCLEDFELTGCHGFDHVKILSRSLKHLIIEDTSIMSITIDAPSILYFKLSCHTSVPSISLATVASREWKSYISVPYKAQTSTWFLKLNEVIKALTQSRIFLSIQCDYMLSQHIKDIVSYCEPVAVEQLYVWGLDSCIELAALFNCLSVIFRPSYIRTSMLHLNIKRLAELILNTGLKNGEFNRCYFGHQELKELKIEILDINSGQWHLVQWSSLPEAAACTGNKEIKRVRYVFEWGDGHV